MKLNQLSGFVFDSESGVIGEVIGADFIKQTVTIATDDKPLVVKLEDAEFLEVIGAIGGEVVINHDVVATADDKLYEIVAVDENNVQLHLLNEKLERVEAGDVIARTDLHVLTPYVTLVGSIYQLEPTKAIDFNIKVVRISVNGEIKFFYACNNVENEEIDLIKVVFVGHHMLEEELYERLTMSHEDYLDGVEAGTIVETNPQALQNYVTGLMFGKKEEPVAESCCTIEEDFDNEDCDCYESTVDFDEDEEDDTCEECGELVEECECEDW